MARPGECSTRPNPNPKPKPNFNSIPNPNPNPNPKLKPNPNSNPSPNPNQVVLNPPDKGTKLLWSAADELLVIQASGLLALSQVT